MWTPEELESLCADAWPAVVEDKIGDWRLRAARDVTSTDGDGQPFTGRANSALTVGDPGLPIAQALDKVCEFAHTQRIPAMAQVIEGGNTERALAEAGWVPKLTHAAGSRVAVLLGPLGTGASPASLLAEPTSAWWELTVGNPEPTPAQRYVLTTGETAFGVVEVDGVTAGVVRAAITGDVLFIARLAVRPAHRRRGLAKALMTACGQWAADRGASACALQVAVDNAPALALYRALGFSEHHRYRYWVPATACKDRVP